MESMTLFSYLGKCNFTFIKIWNWFREFEIDSKVNLQFNKGLVLFKLSNCQNKNVNTLAVFVRTLVHFKS